MLRQSFINARSLLLAVFTLIQFVHTRAYNIYDCSDIETKAQFNAGHHEAAARLEDWWTRNRNCMKVDSFEDEFIANIPGAVQVICPQTSFSAFFKRHVETTFLKYRAQAMCAVKSF